MMRTSLSGFLRRLAAWLIRGPEASFILADLDDTMERELARGLPAWRVWWRYGVNMLGSAYSVWRSRRSFPSISISGLDVKLGMRMLVKNPGLTLVAIIALAIGIPFGLVPAHFVNAIEAPLPVPDADRIQALRNVNIATSSDESPSLYDFVRWRSELTSFVSLGVACRGSFNVNAEDGRAVPVVGAAVTATTFDILRVRPQLGRTLVHGDEEQGAPAVVVIGNELWESRFGRDPGVVGMTMRIGRTPHTIVGVMPKGFAFPSRDQLWLPLQIDAHEDRHRTGQAYMMFGRLSDDVTPAEAQIELTTIGRRMGVESPDLHALLEPEVVPFAIGYFSLPRGGFRALPGFYLVQSLTMLLLVVACANVAMLILARTASRTSELAVRTALGASRTRVVLQLFIEALVFSVMAAGVGLVTAHFVSHRFVWMEQALPFWVDLGISGRTVFWALCLAVLSAGIVSIIPALKVTGVSVQQTIQRAASRRSGVRFGGMSSALIVADVALAVVAVGLALGLWNNLTTKGGRMGVRADEFLTAEFGVPRVPGGDGGVLDSTESVQRVGAVQRQLVRRLVAEPGVRHVAMASTMPGMDHSSDRVEIEGQEMSGDSQNPRVYLAHVDVNFFAAFQQPILAGRGFELSDLEAHGTAVVVNTTFVDEVLEGRNPIGRRVRYEVSEEDEPGSWFEIVGVVGSLGMNEALPGLDAGVYHPVAPGEINPIRLAIHVGANPSAFTPRLREIATAVEPSAIISEPAALDEVFSFYAFTIRWIELGAVAVFGILVSLSVSGIYALMSFTIAQRTKELGIRSALGAQRNRIILLIAKRALGQLGIGVLLGMAIAGRLLFELGGAGEARVESPVVVTMLIGVGVMILIASLACTAPAIRVLRIKPTDALRDS